MEPEQGWEKSSRMTSREKFEFFLRKISNKNFIFLWTKHNSGKMDDMGGEEDMGTDCQVQYRKHLLFRISRICTNDLKGLSA